MTPEGGFSLSRISDSMFVNSSGNCHYFQNLTQIDCSTPTINQQSSTFSITPPPLLWYSANIQVFFVEKNMKTMTPPPLFCKYVWWTFFSILIFLKDHDPSAMFWSICLNWIQMVNYPTTISQVFFVRKIFWRPWPLRHSLANMFDDIFFFLF